MVVFADVATSLGEAIGAEAPRQNPSLCAKIGKFRKKLADFTFSLFTFHSFIALFIKIWYYIFMNKIYILPRGTDAYGFVKQIAAEKYNIVSSALEIMRNAHGKPYFKNIPDFHFNISHSGDFLAIAISNRDVGIDIEKIRKPDFRITKRFCSDEQAYITETDSINRFFEVWTKKEACLKYKGTGLSGGLNTFSIFEFSPLQNSYIFNEYIISVCGHGNFELVIKT